MWTFFAVTVRPAPQPSNVTRILYAYCYLAAVSTVPQLSYSTTCCLRINKVRAECLNYMSCSKILQEIVHLALIDM